MAKPESDGLVPKKKPRRWECRGFLRWKSDYWLCHASPPILSNSSVRSTLWD